MNGERGNSAQTNTDGRVRNAAVCVVAEASPPRPQSLQGEPWSRASAGLCVCVSLRRGRHVLVVPQRFKFTVTAVTGSCLKQPKSPPSQCRTVVPPHKRAARIGTARVRSRPCFCEKGFFEPSANSGRPSSSGLDILRGSNWNRPRARPLMFATRRWNLVITCLTPLRQPTGVCACKRGTCTIFLRPEFDPTVVIGPLAPDHVLMADGRYRS